MYLNHWGSLEEMKADFWPNYSVSEYNGELDGMTVLLASYGSGSYEGDAFVLFQRGGKLYEVNGSHCSCYGLEGQWSPEETTIEELRHRLEEGELGSGGYCDNKFDDELRQVLGELTV